MFIRNHNSEWTKKELNIIYRNYWKLTIKQIKELLPNRSFCAVKNKIKKVKYGKT